MDFSELLWVVSRDFVHISEMTSEQLVEYYLYMARVRDLSEYGECTKCEKIAAQNLFDNIKAEVDRRGIKIVPLSIHLDREGNFVRGREDLKSYWSSLSFDDMVEAADQALEQCVNEAQRMALIELEREIIYEGEEGVMN